jgi:hypothetical protein
MTPAEKKVLDAFTKRMSEVNIELADLVKNMNRVERLKKKGVMFPPGTDQRYQTGMNRLLRTLQKLEDGILALRK